MIISAGLSSKSLASIVGCFIAEYLLWMNEFHKFSIVSCSLRTFAAHSLLAIPSNPLSVMAALNVFLKSKYTQINRISLINKHFQYGLLKVSSYN